MRGCLGGQGWTLWIGNVIPLGGLLSWRCGGRERAGVKVVCSSESFLRQENQDAPCGNWDAHCGNWHAHCGNWDVQCGNWDAHWEIGMFPVEIGILSVGIGINIVEVGMFPVETGMLVWELGCSGTFTLKAGLRLHPHAESWDKSQNMNQLPGAPSGTSRWMRTLPAHPQPLSLEIRSSPAIPKRSRD